MPEQVTKPDVLRWEGSLFCGLDLSLTGTGVCVLDSAGAPVAWATVGSKLKRSSSVREKVQRLIDIASCIMDVVGEYDPAPRVAIEGYAFAAPGAQNDLGELHGVVKSQLWLGLAVEPEIIPPTQARKVVIGNGRAKKNDVQAWLQGRAIRCSNHNEADAYVVAECLRTRHVDKGEPDG